jgi:hypothetical protein
MLSGQAAMNCLEFVFAVLYGATRCEQGGLRKRHLRLANERNGAYYIVQQTIIERSEKLY